MRPNLPFSSERPDSTPKTSRFRGIGRRTDGPGFATGWPRPRRFELPLALVTLAALAAQAAVTDVVWYRLGENDPGAASGQVVNATTADLISGRSLRRFGSPRYTNGVLGTAEDHAGSSLAVAFAAAGQFYSNAVVTTARDNFGLEAWITPAGGTSTQFILHNGNAALNGWGLVMDVGGSRTDPIYSFSGLIGGGTRVGSFSTGRSLPGMYLALVRDNGVSTFYVNGVAVGVSSVTPSTPTGAFALGANGASPTNNPFRGSLDEVRVFTFAPGQFRTNDLRFNLSRVVTQAANDLTTNSAHLRGSVQPFTASATAWFEWGATPDLGEVTPPVAVGNTVAVTNFNALITGLRGGDTYFFRAATSNRFGLAFGETLSFTPPIAPGQGGFAISFDGVDDFVSMADHPRFNAIPLVATAWVKTTQATGEVGLLNKYVAGSINGWQIALVNGQVRAWYIRSAANQVWDGGFGLNGGSISDGQWHHVAFVVDEAGGSIYVDGSLKDVRGWTGLAGNCTTTEPLKLGRYPGGAGEFFRGVIDEVAVWSSVSQDQGTIQTNMNRGLLGVEFSQATFGEIGLAVYHRFREGSGDVTRNVGNTGDFARGTLRNGAPWVPGIVLRPAIQTRTATAVRVDSARLTGQSNPSFAATTAWFEWGPTTAYGNATPAQFLGQGTSNLLFHQSITGLTENVTYHFRAVASNTLGASYGLDQSFAATGTNMISPRTRHTATLLPNGKVLVVGGLDENGDRLATVELYDPATGQWAPTTPMLSVRYNHTATVLPNGRVLVTGGDSVAFAPRLRSAELYDPVTGNWTPTGSMKTNRSEHTATLLLNGKVLVAGGFSASSVATAAELYDPASGTWTDTEVPLTPRVQHTATRLRNGTVLLAGGVSVDGTQASVDLYDPETGSWTRTGSMSTNRQEHTATLLRDGRVLVVGGRNQSPSTTHRSAELYDPSTGTWTNTGGMLNSRSQHTATLLLDGRVFASGLGIGSPSIYDPTSGTWEDVHGPDPGGPSTATLLSDGNVLVAGGTLGGVSVADASVFVVTNVGAWLRTTALSQGQSGHAASMLPDGRVLVTGPGSTIIFQASGSAWSNAPSPGQPRAAHRATLLGNGQVLISGGYTNSVNGTRSSELFDPVAETWSRVGDLNTPRGAHTATLLADGGVLAAGGFSDLVSGSVAQASAERFDLSTRSWTTVGPMHSNRAHHTATLLPNGRVLVAGGLDNGPSGASTASAELFDPVTRQWTLAARMKHPRAAHTATLLPSGVVLVAGGFTNSASGSIAAAELYQPATDTWTETRAMSEARSEHTATVLPGGQVLVARGRHLDPLSSAELYDPVRRRWQVLSNSAVAASGSTATLLGDGRVLVAGGHNQLNPATTVELFELRQGFSPLFRPVISAASSPVSLGDSLVLAGTQFRALSEGSGGGARSSPVDHPVVQLRRLDNEQITCLPATLWSATNFTSAPLSDFAPGHVMVTVFAGGIPGPGAIVNLAPAAPIELSATSIVGGAFRFRFTGPPNAIFTVLGSSEISLPLSNWIPLGPAIEVAPGRYEFSDAQFNGQSRRFLRVGRLP